MTKPLLHTADKNILAYLAGAIDSDGHITLHRGSNTHICASEKVGFKQITTDITSVLKETFGGSVYISKPAKPDGKPLYVWEIHRMGANTVCRQLLPYLRVKKKQAQLLIDFEETRNPEYRNFNHWFLKEFPKWQDLPMITSLEASVILGYNRNVLSRKAENGTFLALPLPHNWPRCEYYSRFPELYIQRVAETKGTKKFSKVPKELLAWKNQFHSEMWKLNHG